MLFIRHQEKVIEYSRFTGPAKEVVFSIPFEEYYLNPSLLEQKITPDLVQLFRQKNKETFLEKLQRALDLVRPN